MYDCKNLTNVEAQTFTQPNIVRFIISCPTCGYKHEVNLKLTDLNKTLVTVNTTAKDKIAHCSAVEKDILIEGYGMLHYTFSNDLNKILEAICLRTGIIELKFIERFGWTRNIQLSENVKKAMKQLNVTYSMTFLTKKNKEYLVINKYSKGKWFIKQVAYNWN